VAPTRVNSRTGTPVGSSPAPSSTISSIFTRALSLGGTPSGPGPFLPSDQYMVRPFGLLSPRGRGRLARQRSLESSDSLSPAGPTPVPPHGSPRPPMVRGLSEGGEEPYRPVTPGQSISAVATPTSGPGGYGLQNAMPRQMRPRFRPPYPPRGPPLHRGRSFGDNPAPSPMFRPMSTSASFHNRPVTPQVRQWKAFPFENVFLSRTNSRVLK
jgi:hypothetical protein